MNVEELISKLEKIGDKKREILVSQDREGNQFKEIGDVFEVENYYVIWPYD